MRSRKMSTATLILVKSENPWDCLIRNAKKDMNWLIPEKFGWMR